MLIGFDTTDVPLLHRQAKPCLLIGDGFAWWYRGHHFRYRSNEQREAYTDGMSSPQFAHAISLFEPYGWMLPAAVPHDGGYHGGLEVETPAGWKPENLDKDECDMMFHQLALVLAGNDKDKQNAALVAYEAVHFGGLVSWNIGHAAKAT